MWSYWPARWSYFSDTLGLNVRADGAHVPIFTIEGSNRQLSKVTKAKTIFPTDDSLFKMLYLAMMDITKNALADIRIAAEFISI